jgi:hypothetical protein
LANVGESGESVQHDLANVGEYGESAQHGLANVGKSGKSGTFPKKAILASTRIRHKWRISGKYLNSLNLLASGHCLEIIHFYLQKKTMYKINPENRISMSYFLIQIKIVLLNYFILIIILLKNIENNLIVGKKTDVTSIFLILNYFSFLVTKLNLFVSLNCIIYELKICQ